jgi:plastocyanin
MNKKIMIIVGVIILILTSAVAIIYYSKSKSAVLPKIMPPVMNTNASPEPNIPAANVPVSNVIMIENFTFTPKDISIKAGDTVTWKQNDSAPHTIVSPGLFESEVLNRGEEYGFTFFQAGEYDYNCGIHPSMKGKITVVK